MKRYLTALLTVISLGWSFTALAVDATCESCTYSQMESTAKGLGIGNHRVVSISTNDINAFSVSCPASGQTNGSEPQKSDTSQVSKGSSSDGPTTYTYCNRPLRAEWRDVRAEDYVTVNAAYEFTLGTGVMPASIEINLDDVPQSFAQTVTHILNDYPARQAMFDHILSSQGLISKYAYMAQANALSMLSILPNAIVVNITFKDGSKVSANWDATIQTLTLIPSTSRASNGVAVIEGNGAGYAGNYSMTGVNLQGYLSYLSSLGIPVTSGGSGSGGHLTCTWNSASTTLTCSLNMQ